MRKYIKNGFTLVELLVVISILGILATIGLVAFSSAQMRGRDTQRKSDLKQTSNALEIYYNDHGSYPSSQDGKIRGCPSTTSTVCDWNNDNVFTDGRTIYLKSMAEDPSGGFNYFYEAGTGNLSYSLYAHLENSQDSAIDTGITTSCGEKLCNFKIESSNAEQVQ
jgi:general secretion pathway protein G